MDHAEATRRLAAEQYVLGELSDADRDEFEKHFFECEECSEAVETGVGFVANARSEFRERAIFAPERRPEKRKWFAWGWGFAPAAALAGWAVAAILAGLSFFHTPGAPLVVAPAISVRAARSAQALTFSRQSGIIALTVAHEWEQPYSGYEAEIARAGEQRAVLTSKAAASPADVSITIQPAALGTGSYILTVYGLREGSAEKTPVARVPFTLTD